MRPMRVLVVDDEPQIQKLLKVALTAAGYETLIAGTAAEALRAVTSAAPDVVILDLGLPDRDGKDVLKDMRAFSKTPVVVLSARDREAEKIEALDLGADDYVEKPFGVGELIARLRVALRHAASPTRQPQCVTLDGLVVDLDKRLVSRDGAPIRLTPKEFGLLAVLAHNAGRVLTHRHILAAVWGPAHVDDIQYLRVLMGQLRAKVERDPTRPAIVRTEPGVGYRIVEPSEARD
jgi:two-component system, OmpR family, KDP operon response regulator KdpE